MNRSARLIVALIFVATLLTPAAAAAAPTRPGCVVIILAPYVTWSDVMSGSMPATRSLAESSTVGDLNIRSSVRSATRPNTNPPQTQVALTMSAGSPATFDFEALPAYAVSQRLESGTAAEIYGRSMGREVGNAAIVYLGLPRILRANASATLDTVPGALGQAIVDAGGATAAIGNSDGGRLAGDAILSRPAAVLAMDATGLVRCGDVSGAVLKSDPAAPFGMSTDIERMRAAYTDALRSLEATAGPKMLVLDPGDPERAFNFTVDAAPDAAEKHRLAAAATIDRVVAMALEDLPDGAVLMVLSSGLARPEVGPSGFGPVIAHGPGFGGGMVASPSTHRAGLMTDLDVSATVLSILGIDRPVDILGNAVTSGGRARSLDERVAYLGKLNATAVAVDTVRPNVQSTYITLGVIILLACVAALKPLQRSYATWGRRIAAAMRAVILLLLGIPVAATLCNLIVRMPGTPGVVATAFVGASLLIWCVSLVIDRRHGSAAALAFVGLFSAFVLLADQLFGAPLSFSGMFSYSPLLGARYYGLGNEGASIMVGGSLAGFGMLLDAFRGSDWTRPVRRIGPPVLGALVVFAAAAPFLGANVGVVAWGTVAFGILWTQLSGRRVTWKTIAAIVLVIGILVACFSIYDLTRSAGSQTHLGRAWTSAETGGLTQLWLIVSRKAETNWRVLRSTNWSFLMLAILGVLGFMRSRPQGLFAETLEAYPAFAMAMTAALWGSLAGYFTEDSGIVIPALVMLYITGSLLHVMVSRIGPASAEERV